MTDQTYPIERSCDPLELTEEELRIVAALRDPEKGPMLYKIMEGSLYERQQGNDG